MNRDDEFALESRRITSKPPSDYSKVIIVVAAILIFVLAIIIAICIMLMQRKIHRKKLLLAAEIEKEEEEERKRRHERKKVTPKRALKKKKEKDTSKIGKFRKPKSKEEMMKELSDFLETHSKKYDSSEEPNRGSAGPTLAPTPTVTPGLLSSEVDVSFTGDSRLQKRSVESTEYHRFEQQFTPKVYEKEVVYRTPSTEWGKKAKKKVEALPIPAKRSSKSALVTPTGVNTGSIQATPTAVEHETSVENKSYKLRSWDLKSAEKEGYSEDRVLEPWEEENFQPSEKAKKEDDGSHKPSQENVDSKEPPE